MTIVVPGEPRALATQLRALEVPTGDGDPWETPAWVLRAAEVLLQLQAEVDTWRAQYWDRR